MKELPSSEYLHQIFEYLHQIFEYSEQTGLLTRKTRPRIHFKSDWSCNAHNARLDGKVVDTIGKSGYVEVKVDGVTRKAHRLIWKMVTGAEPSRFLDDINGDRSDNRWANLRDVSRSQNGFNRGLSSNSTSGVSGVSYHSRDEKWQAYITTEGIRKQLGTYETIELAIKARDLAETDKFGEYRRNK